MNTTHVLCPLGCSAWWVAGLIWCLLGSALLWQTWNKVIGAVTKVKPVKYWQALLFIVTCSVLCWPRMMHHCCGHNGQGMGHGDCPYEHGHPGEPAGK